jgi:hypothetical protein
MTTNANGKVGMALISKTLTYQKVEGNFFEVAGLAFNQLCKLTWSMVDALGQMVQGLAAGGKSSAGHPAVGLQDLHGVLAVVKIGADIAQQDWSQLFLFTIMISMDLAIINLVPWPALDGGHLAFMTFEAIRGRPMGERAQGEIVKWGFLGLMVLMVVIMANDITALFTGKLDYKKRDAASKDAKPGDAKPEDAKPDGAKPDGPRSGESSQSDAKSDEAKSDTKTGAKDITSDGSAVRGVSKPAAASPEPKTDAANANAAKEGNSK